VGLAALIPAIYDASDGDNNTYEYFGKDDVPTDPLVPNANRDKPGIGPDPAAWAERSLAGASRLNPRESAPSTSKVRSGLRPLGSSSLLVIISSAFRSGWSAAFSKLGQGAGIAVRQFVLFIGRRSRHRIPRSGSRGSRYAIKDGAQRSGIVAADGSRSSGVVRCRVARSRAQQDGARRRPSRLRALVARPRRVQPASRGRAEPHARDPLGDIRPAAR